MAGSPVSIAELFRVAIDSRVDDIIVARPGKIVAYDETTNTAFVKPMIKRALFDDNNERTYEELPDIPFVPVIWPRAGKFVLSLPLEEGDPVLLLFVDVSMAEWRATGDLSEPTDARRHSVGWPVAIPGLYPDTQTMGDGAARKTNVIFGRHDGDARIEISAEEIKIGRSASDFVALAAKVDAALAKITDAFSSWAPAPNDGGAALKTAWDTNVGESFDSVAASITKAQ